MSQPTLEPGYIVAARYRIDRAIGRGGYGTVYCATRMEDNRAVALKLMHDKHVANPEKLKRFQREAALVTRLHHLNVVDTLDYGHTDDGLPFIVFELLRGHSLKFRLKKEGALSFSRTCQISIQVLRALTAAHELGIAHRDIKPANIYLCAGREDDFVKVLDFGIAKALDEKTEPASHLTRVGQMLGTPAYMSPEQIKGYDVGLSCDLYSTGLLMAELLSGRRVITGANEQMALLAHLSATPHDLSEAVMETPLGRIIARAVEKEPADRFASATEMLAAVEAVAAADRFGAGAAPATSAEAAPPPSALSLLKETVRTAEVEAPPPSSLAGLKQTVRTGDPDAPPSSNLAQLQSTVRMDPDVSMDDILAAHGINLPPPSGAITQVAHTGEMETVDAQAPPAVPVVGTGVGVAGESERAHLPTTPNDERLKATVMSVRREAKRGRWLPWALGLMVVVALAVFAALYWFTRPPTVP